MGAIICSKLIGAEALRLLLEDLRSRVGLIGIVALLGIGLRVLGLLVLRLTVAVLLAGLRLAVGSSFVGIVGWPRIGSLLRLQSAAGEG